MNKNITLFGSTGSIGTQTLDVVSSLNKSEHNVKIIGMTAYNNVDLFLRQVEEFKPEFVFINEDKQNILKSKFPDIKILPMCDIAKIKVDVVVTAMSGNGEDVTISAAQAGNNIALANKETLVYNGFKVMEAVRKHKIKIFPVDSELSAIWQCMGGVGNNDFSDNNNSHDPENAVNRDLKSNDPNKINRVTKIILTCSGGPFFGKDTDFLKNVKLEDVLKHPTWNMGSKITVDSATLMNKGYELVETMFLFGIHPKNIEIVIHPQSIIHSAVEFADGSVIAQMSNPDMRLPIQYALTYPHRLESNVKPLSLTDIQNISFYKPDLETFTTLKNMITAADKYYTELYVNNNPNAVNVPAQLAKFNDNTVTDFLNGKKSFYSIFNSNVDIN